jgi:hypothetical protein
MAEAPQLTLLHGGGDMIEMLEKCIASIKEGQTIGVVLCTVEQPKAERHETEPTFWWQWAHHEELPFPFGTLLGTLTCAQHTLLQEGLC